MRRPIVAGLMALLTALPAAATERDGETGDWQAVLDEAAGQTVYWNAWAGDAGINDYIAWVGEELAERHDVTLVHVKVADIAETVARVLAERTAGRDADGSVDLMWLNGENFAAMKREGLLGAPFTQHLPNFALVDIAGKPTTLVDFTVPTDGLESPWGMAQFVFMHDRERVAEPPASMEALADWAVANPGRFTYPQPPDFIGSTFLKQALIAFAPDPAALARPVAEDTFGPATAPLWDYLDRLHPALWRGGRSFPASGPELRRLLGDGEIDIALSFQPAEASRMIADGQLPPTIGTFVLDGGTIGNTHFVAIPYNATARAGAMVVANFLLSPEAQARKLDPAYWGDFTVLDLDGLSDADRAPFDAIDLGPATLAPGDLGTPLPEPHPSWMTELEAAWLARYAGG